MMQHFQVADDRHDYFFLGGWSEFVCALAWVCMPDWSVYDSWFCMPSYKAGGYNHTRHEMEMK
jgi:hypothetical protein